MKKNKILDSLIATIISTFIYIIIIAIYEKGNLNYIDFFGFGFFAIIMFLSNIFIIQNQVSEKSKKSKSKTKRTKK